MTQSFYPTSAIAKGKGRSPILIPSVWSINPVLPFLSDAGDADKSPCLLDRIQLNLDQIEVYIGKRHDVKGVGCLFSDIFLPSSSLKFG